MSKYSLTAQELQSAIGELSSSNAQFKARVADLQSKQGALAGMWQGDAHDAFWVSFDQDNQMLVKLFANLRNIAQGAATAKNEYATCEQGVVDTINSVGF